MVIILKLKRKKQFAKIDFHFLASKTKFNDQKACGHMGAFLVACLNTQMFKNCPESSWMNGMSFIFDFFFFVS